MDEIRTRRNRICTTRFLNFGAFFSPAGKSCVGTKAGTRPGGPDAVPVILHGVLHFSRKALLFVPKGSTILLLVPTRFCGRMPRNSAWCGQNGRDETACFDPGGAQTALGTQNSKCDRALTAPPEFKSLMLRQKTLRKRLLPEFSFIPIPSVYRSQDGTMSKYLYEDADLMAEWDFEKNSKLGLSPEKLTFGSNKNAWWKCKRGHAWQAVICKRTNGNQCPFCANKRVLVGYNDLPTLFPDLAREWDKEKNKKVELLSVVPGSAKSVYWKCAVCGCSWKTSIRQRTQRKTGCPACAKIKRAAARRETFLKRSGSVADSNIAGQWNYEKNSGLTPEQFTPASNQSVWWKCSECGYEWKARICNRVVLGRGCPCCANKTVVPGKNDLATVRPELAKEWHSTANGALTPQQVTVGCGKKVWWQCPYGHEYQASVLHRGHGTNCPICNSGRQTSFAEQALFYYIRQVYPDAISRCRDILPGRMELDLYIPSIRVAIEYDGSYWHRNKQKTELEKYRQCTENGIKLIRVKEEMQDGAPLTADNPTSVPCRRWPCGRRQSGDSP